MRLYLLLIIISFVQAETEILEKGKIIDFTEEDISLVVGVHNQFRAVNITPPASDMREISWDRSLASFASEWTSNCEYKFKENTTTEQWTSVGQSFFLAAAPWTTDFHFSSTLSWLEQGLFYTYDNGSCTDFCGHYVQLVYSETYKVGCSASYCPVAVIPGSGQRIPNATFYMCAYLPQAALEDGFAPYKTGTSCANCSDSSDVCTDMGLCSNPNRDEPIPVPVNSNTNGGGFTADWSMIQKVIAGVSSSAVLMGILGAAVKLCKGGSVQPSLPQDGVQEQNVSNGKAQANPSNDTEAN